MVKVAAAQIKVTGDIDANLQKIISFIGRAKVQKADIVCFPEGCLNWDDKNRVDVSEQVKKIQKVCKEKSIWCIFGSYVSKKNKVKNVVFLIDRAGEIKYEYDKVHLWRTEKSRLFPEKRIGLSIRNLGKSELLLVGIPHSLLLYNDFHGMERKLFSVRCIDWITRTTRKSTKYFHWLKRLKVWFFSSRVTLSRMKLCPKATFVIRKEF
ncbi:MAG: carbon-nitrogen hydrolase family protein [Candidatus Gracilibacteria bacterium]